MKGASLVTSALSVMLCASSAVAQTPSGFNDLVGARAAGGETAMQSRGYRFVKAEKGDDRSYAYWWNGSSRQCVTVATMDGRYSSITSTPAPDCNQGANSGDASGHRARPGYGSGPGYGYGSNGSPSRQSPSYAEDRDRGQARYDTAARGATTMATVSR